MFFIKKTVTFMLALGLATPCPPLFAEDVDSLFFSNRNETIKRTVPYSAVIDGEFKSEEMGFLYDEWRDGDIILALTLKSKEITTRVEQRIVTFVVLSDDGYCGQLTEINAATNWTALNEVSASVYYLRKLHGVMPKINQQELLRLTKDEHPELIGLAKNHNYVFSSRIELKLSFFNNGKLSSFKEIKMPSSFVCL